ncbi:MAG: hypothetical protein FWD34_02530 [Oscillospiraceae bacterium]|nr:hypothetical protein [Oscillospiraceae bacterium]
MNNENLQDKERFIDDGQSVNVIHSPQCVDCVFNMGLLDCAMLGEKPEKYLSNEEKCPEFEAE